MDDDRLASELQRRASGASPPPDWASRDLLPAVWREIDARPQRVLASRWSPLAGVATLVVALLVLVVAIPRLGPQPPSATSQRTPREIACNLTDSRAIVVTVVDTTALIKACEVAGASQAGTGSAPAYVVALNATRTLEFGWIGAACSFSATVTFRPDGDGYALEAVETPRRDDCYGGIAMHAIHIALSEWVDPLRVAAHGRGYVLPAQSPTPTVSPTAAIGCEWQGWYDPQTTDGTPEPAPSLLLPPPVFIDQTGLVASCFSTDRPLDLFARPVIDAVSDLGTSYHINWGTTVCDTASTVTFAPAGDRFTIEINRGTTEHCDGISHRMIAIELREPVDPRLIDLVWPSPSPTPSIAQSPSPAANAVECAPLSATQLPPGSGTAMVHDSTGLVDSCEMVPSTGSESDPPVLNYEGDPSVVVVRWFGRPCDADSDLFLRPTSEPDYTFELEVRMYNTNCRSSRVLHEARLHLSSPLDASAIYAWSTRVPPPSPTPSPVEPGARTLSCGTDAMGSDISIVDHSGLLSSCVTGTDNPPTPAAIHVVNGIDIQHLEVAWLTDSHLLCGSHPAALEFWGPGKHSEDWLDRSLPNYVLRVARLDTTGPCSEGSRTQRVELTFSAPVSAFDVEAFVDDLTESANSNSSTVTAETADGTFNLLIGAGLWDFAADAPIDISAYIEYEGPAQSVTVSGQPLPILGFEQLDGDLEVYPGPTIAMCPPDDVVLRRRAGVDGRFEHSEYTSDGQLRLPAGTYRVFATVSFNVGPNCTGDHVALRTSIVIHVR